MLDIMLDSDGDIKVSAIGDISTTQSVRQAVLVRLRWILNEWRLGPSFGFPWFEQVFVKNPNTNRIRQLFRDEIMKVAEVTSADVTLVKYDPSRRSVSITYVCHVGEAVFREEVTLYA